MFGPLVDQAIEAAAIAAYPKEMCGAVVEGPDGFEFRALDNVAEDPLHHFDCSAEFGELQVAGTARALVHSHPDGPDAPSFHDIASQRAMDLPWGLVICSAEVSSRAWWWGDSLQPPPLEGRMFRHGPSGSDGRGDCGALIRDWLRLMRGIIIPDFPRDDRWWNKGADLYADHWPAAGFTRIDLEQTPPQPGDVILLQINTPAEHPVCNHAAIHVGGGYMMHHLENRLSRIEPILPWRKHIRTWLRHHAI